MTYPGLAWRAFRNMMRAAAHDPVWAVTAIVISPFRAWRYVVGCAGAVASGYLSRLVGNKAIACYLGQHQGELLGEFQSIVAATSLDQAVAAE